MSVLLKNHYWIYLKRLKLFTSYWTQELVWREGQINAIQFKDLQLATMHNRSWKKM